MYNDKELFAIMSLVTSIAHVLLVSY